MDVLQTDRLLLRHLTRDDVDDLFEVLGDAGAMRYYPRPKTRSETLAWIEWSLRLQDEHGLGLRGVVLRSTGELIGDCGLTRQSVDDTIEVEIGYHIKPRFQRQGYATEAALAWRDFARDRLCLDRLVAIIDPRNVPSRGVAIKLGMTLERDFFKNGLPMLLFSQSLR